MNLEARQRHPASAMNEQILSEIRDFCRETRRHPAGGARPTPASATRSTSSTWPGWSSPRGRRRGLPRHPARHRLPHHHDQRTRRARLGRRRHRGRGGHARPAGVDADPPGGRLQADRVAAGGLDRHRPGADRDRDAAQARGGRQVRGVLRRGRVGGAARQPGHHRQHVARSTARPAPSSRSTTRPCATWSSPAGRGGAVALVEAYAKEQGLWHDPTHEPDYSERLEPGPVDGGALAGRPGPTPGPGASRRGQARRSRAVAVLRFGQGGGERTPGDGRANPMPVTLADGHQLRRWTTATSSSPPSPRAPTRPTRR